jgi:predicted dehydrogenase
MYSHRLNLGIVRSDENALWSLAPHDISVILYLFGAFPDQVTANGASYLQPGIEDVVFVNLHFPDGRTAQIHVSWLDPHKEREMVLVGSKCMVVFDDMSPMEPVRVYHKGADVTGKLDGPALVTVRHGDVLIPHFSGGEPLQTEAQHFIDAVRQGTTPRSDGLDGLRVVQVLEAADRSLKAGGHGFGKCLPAAKDRIDRLYSFAILRPVMDSTFSSQLISMSRLKSLKASQTSGFIQ